MWSEEAFYNPMISSVLYWACVLGLWTSAMLLVLFSPLLRGTGSLGGTEVRCFPFPTWKAKRS